MWNIPPENTPVDQEPGGFGQVCGISAVIPRDVHISHKVDHVPVTAAIAVAAKDFLTVSPDLDRKAGGVVVVQVSGQGADDLLLLDLKVEEIAY